MHFKPRVLNKSVCLFHIPCETNGLLLKGKTSRWSKVMTNENDLKDNRDTHRREITSASVNLYVERTNKYKIIIMKLYLIVGWYFGCSEISRLTCFQRYLRHVNLTVLLW